MPIYEYDCRACGPFSDARPMAASALPAPCPRCARQSPRVLSATAIGHGARTRRPRAEPSLVVKERRPPKVSKVDPLRRPRPDRGGRPWMLGH